MGGSHFRVLDERTPLTRNRVQCLIWRPDAATMQAIERGSDLAFTDFTEGGPCLPEAMLDRWVNAAGGVQYLSQFFRSYLDSRRRHEAAYALSFEDGRSAAEEAVVQPGEVGSEHETEAPC